MVRKDWKVPFPVVTDICECGAVQYMHTFDRERRYTNGVLVECKHCKPTEPEILFPHVYKRVFRDVACRYIQRFGGSTFAVQTEIDDCEIYLRDRFGEVIASVSLRNQFSEKIDKTAFEGMPY